MSFLKALFGKQPGGSIFGNVLRGVAKSVPVIGGTVIGTDANKIEFGQTKTNKELAKEAGVKYTPEVKSSGSPITFAGQSATLESNGDIAMSQPLKEVTITPQSLKNPSTMPSWVNKVGDILSNLGGRATENVSVGADNKTLFIVGGGLLLLVAVLAMNNNNNRR